MIILDSSCWIEHFKGTLRAKQYAEPIQQRRATLLPTICLCEVERWLIREAAPEVLHQNLLVLRGTRIIDLTQSVASLAAELGLKHRLPLADSIIYATAKEFGAELWTQDEHFKNLPGVRFFP